MRPGPRLVVMALAFISGAQRGTTTTHNSANYYNNLNNILTTAANTKNTNNNYQQQYNSNFNSHRSEGGSGGGSGRNARAALDITIKYFDDQGPLGRINPWLSACDLAQNRKSPDLQDQCTAGSLPVSRVTEGPGPPDSSLPSSTSVSASTIERQRPLLPVCPLSCRELKRQQQQQQQHAAHSNNNSNNSKSNKNSKLKTIMELTGAAASSANSQQQQQQQQKNIKQQECLSYLGEANEFSPEYLCKSRGDIKSNIESHVTFLFRNLRLRHCCERSILSSLRSESFNDVVYGPVSACIRVLKDLLQTDQLASSITCEFTEILVRYDCKQPYSLINHCDDCREAYRRWVCSTFIPYFATENDVKRNAASGNSTSSTDTSSIAHRKTRDLSIIISGKNYNNSHSLSSSSSSSSSFSSSPSSSASSAAASLSSSTGTSAIKSLRRSRRKDSRTESKRIRIRPCLSVCQTVEQKCPYLLPGDRAPALPTQYAGEPTFLCLDPAIDETPEQKLKSAYGPDECCYTYCDGPFDGLCTACPPSYFNATSHNQSSLADAAAATAIRSHMLHTAAASSATATSTSESTNEMSHAKCPVINWLAPLQCISQYPSLHTKLSSASPGDGVLNSSSSPASLLSAAASASNQHNNQNASDSSHEISASSNPSPFCFSILLLHSVVSVVVANYCWTTTLRGTRLAGL